MQMLTSSSLTSSHLHLISHGTLFMNKFATKIFTSTSVPKCFIFGSSFVDDLYLLGTIQFVVSNVSLSFIMDFYFID